MLADAKRSRWASETCVRHTCNFPGYTHDTQLFCGSTCILAEELELVADLIDNYGVEVLLS